MERTKPRFENNSEAGQRVLEHMEEDSSEHRLFEWVSRAIAEPEDLAAKYFHYMELEQQTEWMMSAPNPKRGLNRKLDWLRDHYYTPIHGFYAMMMGYCNEIYPTASELYRSMLINCYNVEPDTGLSSINYPQYADSKDYHPSKPEFNLDIEEVQKMMIDDKEQRQVAINEHTQCEKRIIRLCGSTLKELPEEMEITFRTPLYILASAHRNIAHCAYFSRFMLDDI